MNLRLIFIFLFLLVSIAYARAETLCSNLLDDPPTVKTFLKGRLNEELLSFKFDIGKDINNGIKIEIYYKHKKYGFVTAGNWDPTGDCHIGQIEVYDQDSTDDRELEHTGVGQMIYSLMAQLSYDNYGRALAQSYESTSDAALDAWARLRSKGVAKRRKLDGYIFYKILLQAGHFSHLVDFMRAHTEPEVAPTKRAKAKS